MDFDFYIAQFNASLANINKKDFNKQGLQLHVGVVLNSVALKIYKLEWSGDINNPITATSRIFFSIWVSDKTIKEGRLYYNIHALKLSALPGYKITSRNFAAQFRKEFRKQMKEWPNVELNFGPLTLMEGWVELNDQSLQKDISVLTARFLKVCPLIDQLLLEYKIEQ
ncbi:MAG: hypothetical protein QM764_05965 [Chitinophagaceae bacterium]